MKGLKKNIILIFAELPKEGFSPGAYQQRR